MLKYLFSLVMAFSACQNETTKAAMIGAAAADALERIQEREEKDAVLGQYVLNAIYAVGAHNKLSDAKKMVLARTVVRVANDIFDKEENKKAFIAIIAIESGFNRFAQSPTGPKGYGQLSKAAFVDASKSCGIKTVHADDIFNEELNLMISACYYRTMLENNGGDQYMAMIAYNQGPYSESIKSYSKNGNLNNIEVLKYVAKFTFLKKAITGDVPVEKLTGAGQSDKITAQTNSLTKDVDK